MCAADTLVKIPARPSMSQKLLIDMRMAPSMDTRAGQCDAACQNTGVPETSAACLQAVLSPVCFEVCVVYPNSKRLRQVCRAAMHMPAATNTQQHSAGHPRDRNRIPRAHTKTHTAGHLCPRIGCVRPVCSLTLIHRQHLRSLFNTERNAALQQQSHLASACPRRTRLSASGNAHCRMLQHC